MRPHLAERWDALSKAKGHRGRSETLGWMLDKAEDYERLAKMVNMMPKPYGRSTDQAGSRR